MIDEHFGQTFIQFCGFDGKSSSIHKLIKRNKKLFKLLYTRFDEFPDNGDLNHFEKCHGDHLHHKVTIATPQIKSFTYKVALELNGWVNASKVFSFDFDLQDKRYDKCFLYYGFDGNLNKNTVLLPMRYSYMDDLGRVCTGVNEGLEDSLEKSVYNNIETHLINTSVRRISDNITQKMDVALEDYIEEARSKNFEKLVEDLINSIEMNSSKITNLHRSSLLINSSRYFRANEFETTEKVIKVLPKIDEVLKFLASNLLLGLDPYKELIDLLELESIPEIKSDTSD